MLVTKRDGSTEHIDKVHQAYVQPSMSSEEGKLWQRTEFGNKWMLGCLEERK